MRSAGKVLLPAIAMLLAVSLAFLGVGAAITGTMPSWRDSVGNVNHTEKITGRYLLEQSAAQGDTLLIFGSSELRTTEISTHPANFFAGRRAGFQVDIIGDCRFGGEPPGQEGGAHHLPPVLCAGGDSPRPLHGKFLPPAVFGAASGQHPFR